MTATAVDRVGAARARIHKAKARRVARARVAALPDGIVPDGPVSVLSHRHDLVVAQAGTGDERAIVHLATDRRSRRLVAGQQSAIESLVRDERLDPIRSLLPDRPRVDRHMAWMVQTASPGRPASDLGPEAWAAARVAGLDVLDRLHDCTAQRARVTEGLLDRWVHGPVGAVAAVTTDPAAARGLAVLHDRLIGELQANRATVARIHGDPSPDNLLYDDDGAVVRAVVDWEATTTGLPECDTVAFLLAWRRLQVGRELGDDVIDLLQNGWSDEEVDDLGLQWSPNAHLRPTTLVLLAWLHHVAANLAKAESYRAHRWWVHANVHRVLRHLADEAALTPPPSEVPAPPPTEPAPPPARSALTATPISLAALRRALVASTAAAWLAWAVDAPTALRIVPVGLALLVLPTILLGRALAMDATLVRTVVAAGGIASANVVASEVLLYAGWWSPGVQLVLIGLLGLAISGWVPRYTAAVPPTPTPPVALRADRGPTRTDG